MKFFLNQHFEIQSTFKKEIMKLKLTPIQIFGLCLLPVSMAIYHFVPQTRGSFEGAALANYPLAILYFFLSFADRPRGTNIFKLVRPKLNWHILLALMLVSCFTLNKDIHVFALTPSWVQLLLIGVLFSFLLVSVKGVLPAWLIKIASFLFGIGILIFLYYAIVLLPFSPIALLGLFLLGISIHLLVPLILVVVSVTCTFSRKCENAKPKLVLAGFTTGIVCVLIYMSLFTYHSNQIKGAQEELVLNEKNDLPEWVSYARNCTSGFWTKRVIGCGLLYEEHSCDWWGFDFNTGSFSEIKQHDPLVAIAALFSDKLPLTNQEQVQILSASANTRHYAYEKLWSGKDLHVSKEVTDVRIYSEYRMAYFEKTFWIENENQWEGNQQEALFTFYLPDGAAASSLSLWIDGKEEKSRLTTRQKATKAYKTIVGKERRDPVVLHWQEGNRLTATIFPCTPKEARRVKIGVTVPLIKEGKRLLFSNMKVLGPDNGGADEVIHVKLVGDSDDVDMPWFFSEELPNQYIYSGDAVEDWSCTVTAAPLSLQPFSFNQHSWRLQPLKFAQSRVSQAIYLDINKSWRKKDVMQIIAQAGNVPVYVFTEKVIQLDLTNVDPLYEWLSKKSFSLFPVFEIEKPESSLLITKGQANSPIPSDLRNSTFHEQLINYMSDLQKPIATLIIEGEKSPFITALEQYKIVECRNVTLAQLKNTGIEHWFMEYKQPQGGVILPMSEMAIVPVEMHNETVAQLKHAPSHLLRLFNYHAVMQRAGQLFLQEEADIPESVYALCNEAFVVTPVSSLIVLETQKDYERFGINDNQNSLKNANLQDSGSVPEPGEWALIIILGIIISFIYVKFR
ncbi:XrtN system VIT domain-containing protein [Marinilabiliaceae bacterium JC017]|nr:XrtN system VIT domain-containing protein [Marinilabiliaceae bacterium JC017]